MNQEVAKTEDTPEEKKKTKKIKLPALKTGGDINAIVPQDLDEVWRLANMIAKAKMAPASFKYKNTEDFNVEQISVAMVCGLEVGLKPFQAIQGIAVIHGTPAIWGDAANGLVQASGLVEDFQEFFEGEGETLNAVCIIKRKGLKTPIKREFSKEDAKTAGLLAKAGQIWGKYLKRMLQMRARSWALRDGFADVLKGLQVREEVETYHQQKTETKAVPVEELLEVEEGEEEIEDAEIEDIIYVTQERATEILETIEVSNEETFPTFRKEVIAEIEHLGDTPLKAQIGKALAEKTDEIKKLRDPEETPEKAQDEQEEEKGADTPEDDEPDDVPPEEPEEPEVKQFTPGELIAEAANFKKKADLQAFYLTNQESIESFTEASQRTVMDFKTEQLKKLI